jgi:iron complex transport system permease protein
LLAISDEISYAHGLNPDSQRILWLALVSSVVAYCVSIAGTIGFLGIIVPRIVRRSVGGNTKVLSIYSSLIGSTILMLSNIISHGLLGYYIPLTAIMSLIGSPIMIMALVRRNASAE